MDLKNKTAIITGGNRGIGAATAILFAEKGANVVITHSSEKTRQIQLPNKPVVLLFSVMSPKKHKWVN